MALVELLARREVSPTELRQAALERARDSNAALNAVVSWTGEVPPGSVPASNADGPLAGIPTFLKDNDDLAGMPTTYGSAATPRQPASATSAYSTDFLSLGLDVLGKTNMPEFGLTASTEPVAFGPVRNPHALGHTAGGSSGGSAALVAAGVVPIAHANDGGGSIRIPAACCGLVGLKTTRGRFALPDSMRNAPVKISTQGVVTRTVRDTALFASVMDRTHGHLPPLGHVTGPDPRRLRIAFFVNGIEGLTTSPDVADAVRRAAMACEGLGHDVVEIDFPFGAQVGRDFLRYWGFLSWNISYLGPLLFGREFSRSRLEPLTKGLADYARRLAPSIPGSIARLRRFEHEYAEIVRPYDVILSPVLGHAPPRLGYLAPDLDFRTHMVRLLRFASFTAIHNISGAPAMSLPLATNSDRLPIAVQLAGAVGHDATLLSLAYELEETLITSANGSISRV